MCFFFSFRHPPAACAMVLLLYQHASPLAEAMQEERARNGASTTLTFDTDRTLDKDSTVDGCPRHEDENRG